MVESTTPRPGRSRRRPATREHLARLTAARNRLDAEQEDRRRREDDLLEQFAAAAVAADDLGAERDRRLADLDRERAEIEQATEAELRDVEGRQTAVLHQLQQLGRTVEQLAELVDIPVKKLRHRLRQHRAGDTVAATSPSLATSGRSALNMPAAEDVSEDVPAAVATAMAMAATSSDTPHDHGNAAV